MSYRIVRRQTTYWDLEKDDRFVRIHFLGKEEFGFTQTRVASYSILNDHSVLLDYRFGWESIYLAGAIAHWKQILSDLTRAIEARVDGWRPAEHYLNAPLAGDVLRKGYGLLLEGPTPVMEASRVVLKCAGARFTTLASHSVRWPRQALITGRNYVVAQSFRVEESS